MLPRVIPIAVALALAGAPKHEARTRRLEAVLRARFPDQAARVLDGARTFAVGRDAFSTAPGALDASLPRRGDDALRFSLGGGAEVRVHEPGAHGAGVSADRAVAYARAGGVSFWAAERDGLEEWLLLDASTVTRDAPVAAWELESATSRSAGEAVEVVDARGDVQLVVTAPEAYARGGRRVDARLAARGTRIELWIDAEGEDVLVDPAWRRTRSMPEGRASHTATALANGRVLLLGGSDGKAVAPTASYHEEVADPATGVFTGFTMASAAVYDPADDTWTEVAPMIAPNVGHTATLLEDGRVLVVGGQTDGTNLATKDVALYDPASNTWQSATSLYDGRTNHVAALLPDGRVLVAGGDEVPSTEIYDPIGDTWTLASVPEVVCRIGCVATSLANGDVLLTGGVLLGGAPSAAAQRWDAAKETWVTAAPMMKARAYHTATLLEDGTVLVAGGSGLSSAELYSPKTNKWISVGSMKVARLGHTASLLPGGRVLVAGGSEDGSAEVYDPTVRAFVPAEPPHATRTSHTATLLPNGRVLLAGGSGNPSRSTAELYDPAARLWTQLPPMGTARAYHTATQLRDGRVLVAGGEDYDPKTLTALSSVEAFDPKTRSWSALPPMSAPRDLAAAALLDDGRVMVAGGVQYVIAGMGVNFVEWNSVEIFDPTTNSWSAGSPMATSRDSASATVLADGSVLVAGGYGYPSEVSLAETYRPSDDTWLPAGSMTTDRVVHTATRLPDGRVFVTGGVSSTLGVLASTEAYDPALRVWKATAPMSQPRSLHTATLLRDGGVLVVGGTGANAEVYTPLGDTWTTVTPMSSARLQHRATLLDNGMVLVAGGFYEAGGDPTRVEAYDPGANRWTILPSLHTARAGHSATNIGGGRVLVAGGTVPPPGLTSIAGPAVATSEMLEPLPAGEPCAAAFECASGACRGGICCESSCGTDCYSCSIADGAERDGTCHRIASCDPFVCNDGADPPACLAACTTSDDCARGFACNTRHECVVPEDVYVDAPCAVAPSGTGEDSGSPLEPAVWVIAALAALRRRRFPHRRAPRRRA